MTSLKEVSKYWLLVTFVHAVYRGDLYVFLRGLDYVLPK
jgi:hypothetical protein